MVTGRQTVTPADEWLALANTLTGIKSLSGGTLEVIVLVDNVATAPVLADLGDVLHSGDRLDFVAGNVAYVKTRNSDKEIVTYA